MLTGKCLIGRADVEKLTERKTLTKAKFSK